MVSIKVANTWGMASHTGSLITFRGEPWDKEPPAFCFVKRGEPDVLRGESGGVLAAENIEGKELLEETLTDIELPNVLNGDPAFASASKDFTYDIEKYTWMIKPNFDNIREKRITRCKIIKVTKLI